jgi:predicted DNA-binding transcriptional regulator YafY
MLEVPFTDARELTMDILRHGSHVEVLMPESLRTAVKAEVALMIGNYAN